MISEWLELFRTSWVAKDVEKVMGLFTDDVEYWETPYKRLFGKSSIENEWSAIIKQRDVELSIEVFSSSNDKHTVLWHLSYIDDQSKAQSWAGTYLVVLDQTGRCSYFHQTGEKQ